MNLKELLQSFNRKERNWLVRDALGAPAEGLDADFRARIQEAVRKVLPDFAFEPDAYWATDFHFDWLVGVLHCLAHPEEALGTAKRNDPRAVTGSQEDIDLVIATGSTLLLIEAKGEGQWSNKQLESKIGRLKAMAHLIDERGQAGETRVLFLLCSPRDAPPRVSTEGWPSWASDGNRALHFVLKRPEGQPFHAVSRCDSAGQSMKDGDHWMIRAIGDPSKLSID